MRRWTEQSLVIWWRHRMETSSAILRFCMMTSSNRNWSTVNSPHKGQWRGALVLSLVCAWINACVNNREAGDLRRAHYDVIVMCVGKWILRIICHLISLWRKVAQRLWQSFISHFNQHSSSWGNIPSRDRQGLTIVWKSFDVTFDTTVIFNAEFHENNNIFVSHPNKPKLDWKIVSTINLTYASI